MISAAMPMDIIVGFEHEADAQPLYGCMKRAVRRVRMTLHPGKDPPDRFGRNAAANAAGVARQAG